MVPTAGLKAPSTSIIAPWMSIRDHHRHIRHACQRARLGRLDRQRERFGFPVAAVGLDAEYAPAHIARGPEERGILDAPAFGTRRRSSRA